MRLVAYMFCCEKCRSLSYPGVRLEDMDVERAKRTVEHDRDPSQRRLA